MAEDTVVKEQLTDAMIEAGAELTRKLDESGPPITAALWMFQLEINEWRLLFTSPDIATHGGLKMYERIQLARKDLGDKVAAAPFSAISLLDPDAKLVRLLRIAIRNRPGGSRIRISKDAINGHYIDDALIYRVA